MFGRILATVLAVFIAANLVAAEGLQIGGAMPAWKDLPGVDGRKHSSDELADAKVVLVIFYANHCPDCQAYLDRIKGVAADYQAKGVATVLVCVSHEEEDDLAHMTSLAKKEKLAAQYLQDKSQRLGKELGAEWTPEAFVFDENRRLVYHGGVDDHWNPKKVKRRHLREALEETLAGKKVTVPTSEIHGCVIEYEE